MKSVAPEVDRYLTLLRNKIREKGSTQLEVQEALGWGRSYISQLVTKQKSLRVEQVLLILSVIGVDPSEFFAEIYAAPHFRRFSSPVPDEPPQQELDQLRGLLSGVVELLLEKELISAEELSATVAAQADKDKAPLSQVTDPEKPA